MTNYIKVIIFITLIAIINIFAPKALAQSCVTQYGGAVVCPPTNLTINKQVAKPMTAEKGGAPSIVFVENLTTSDPFGPETQVLFRLTIKNGSNQTFPAVSVTDVLPPYVTFVSGPGSFNSATRSLSFVLDNMVAGESRTVEILAKTVEAAAFPQGKTVFCVVNEANVRANGASDRDTAQLCLQVAPPAPQLPVAGFNDFLLLLPFMGMGLGGLVLLRKRG